jgi:hypothetical protein
MEDYEERKRATTNRVDKKCLWQWVNVEFYKQT